MKNYLFVFIGLVIALPCFAQQPEIERCYAHKYVDYINELHPGFKAQVDEAFELAKYTPIAKTNQEYVVPVVVHIVYNTPNQNLHDSVVKRQIDLLNKDFKRQNPDTVNMRPDFEIVKGNPNIRFKIAQIDPDGNPTTGITRTETSLESFADLGLITGNFDGLERIKKTAEGGKDPWDTQRYLNIWIGNMSLFGQTFLLGYASPPAGLPNWPPIGLPNLIDGVVVQFDAVGDNNPNLINFGAGMQNALGRTMTHEVGHYLGLRHIWGDGNCNEEDGIDDTPNAAAQSDFDCDATKNTCVDNIQGIDLPDMVENYMDYSDETCQNTFTQGQVDLMRSVLENQRIDLIENNPAGIESYEIPVAIYPNPVQNKLIVESEGGKISHYVIMDISGKQLTQKTLIQFGEIDCSQLEKGTYLLQFFYMDTPAVSRRFVKF
jgi:hypothetical protein